MQFAYTEEQQLIRDTARAFLDEQGHVGASARGSARLTQATI
jgi:hypothetical protein